MEVTLRKTKITASILKQMQHADQGQIFTYKVLGYFMMNTKVGIAPRALLQSHDSEDCKLCMLAKSYKITTPDINNESFLDVVGIKGGTIYAKLDPTYAQNLGDRLIEIMQDAYKAGQIFY